MAVSGLYLEPDTSPYTSGAMNTDNDIVDTVKNVAATANYWWIEYSYGIDLGVSKTLTALKFWFTCGATPSGWYGSNYDSVKIFKSSDGTTWTAVEQFDAPPITDSFSGYGAFNCVFTTAQTARYFKAVNVDTAGTTLAVTGGASIQISEIEYEEQASEQTELVDVSLNLSAYYQDMEDLGTYFRAHDGLEFEDLPTLLAAYLQDTEDLPASLSAYYQDLEDLKLNLKTWAWSLEDIKTVLETQGLSLSDLKTAFMAAGYELDNIKTFLSATDATVLRDMATLLWVTDGTMVEDCKMHLSAIALVPAFRAITAQRLTSVVSEAA